MKKIFIFILLFIASLTGCSNNEYTVFSGESTHWKGKYSVNINGNEEHGNYEFHYKNGDQNTKFRTLEVSINNKFEQISKKQENHKGATFYVSSDCQNCASTSKDETLKVTIKWDDQNEETLLLTTKK